MASVQSSGSAPLWPAGERAGRRRERAAVTINMHQSDGSMRYLTMQANPNSAVPLRKGVGGWGGVKGKGCTPNPPWCSPFPPQPAESSKC